MPSFTFTEKRIEQLLNDAYAAGYCAGIFDQINGIADPFNPPTAVQPVTDE